MNKKNKILVGCLALLLVLSVGYALFSETIEINGTSTAKGSFQITASCANGYSDEFIEAAVSAGLTNINTDTNQSGFSNDICTVNGTDIVYNTNLLYPGAKRFFTIKFTNTGSITAEVPVDEGAYIRKSSSACIISDNDEKNCSQTFPVSGTSFDTLDPAYFIKKPDGTYVTLADEEFLQYYSETDETITLPTGYSTYFVAQIEWPEEYTSDANGNKSANIELSVEHYFDIVQSTN